MFLFFYFLCYLLFAIFVVLFEFIKRNGALAASYTLTLLFAPVLALIVLVGVPVINSGLLLCPARELRQLAYEGLSPCPKIIRVKCLDSSFVSLGNFCATNILDYLGLNAEAEALALHLHEVTGGDKCACHLGRLFRGKGILK